MPGHELLDASRSPSSSSAPMACSIECVGNSCRVIATSPKAKSRSTRQTRRAPARHQRDREVDRHGGLADPALGREDRDDPTSCGRRGRRAAQGRPGRWARCRDAVTWGRSPALMTSRMPACMALARTSASTSSRTRTTLVVGSAVRIRSAMVIASGTERLGPSTTAYSSLRWVSQVNSSVGTVDHLRPGREDGEQGQRPWPGRRREGLACWPTGRGSGGRRRDRAGSCCSSVRRPKDSSPFEAANIRLLGLLLVDGEGQQGLGQLLGGLGAGLVGRRGRDERRGAGGEHLHLGQQQPGDGLVLLVGGGEPDRDVGAGGHEAGDPCGVGELDRDGRLAVRDRQHGGLAESAELLLHQLLADVDVAVGGEAGECVDVAEC